MTTSGQPESSALPPDKAHPAPGAGTMGMGLLILSLSVLFTASIVAYLVVRSRAEVWPPPDMPRLPAGLWVSTIILLTSSATMHWALRSARRDRQGTLRAGMLLTTLLGLAFLISQLINWLNLIAAHVTATDNLYAFCFFLLTGLHAAHVIGGLIPLTIVSRKAFAGRYSSAYHSGVRLCAMYWHFLDVVWLVMFVLIFLIA